MKRVLSLLKARRVDGDDKLAKCIKVVLKTTERARDAVRHDPRQIMGRITLELSSHTGAPVVDLVKRARECKRFRWWYLCKGTLKMGGEGQNLTRVGNFAFKGERVRDGGWVSVHVKVSLQMMRCRWCKEGEGRERIFHDAASLLIAFYLTRSEPSR